jgi:hypothetical protein
MERAGASILLLLTTLLAGPAQAVAQDSDATDSGRRQAGESASNWYDLPFWAWILIAAGGFLLLFGLLYLASRGRRDSGRPAAPATASAPPPPGAAPTPGDPGPHRDLAIATFPHTGGADRAFASALARDPGAAWARETTFVEAHRHGRLVVRGTFAGQYLNVESIHDESPYGAIARAVVRAAFDDLGAELPEGSSALLVFGSAQTVDRMVAELEGHEVMRRHITDDAAAELEAAAARAPLAAPPSP